MEKYLTQQQTLSLLRSKGINPNNLTPKQEAKLKTISMYQKPVASQTQYNGDGVSAIDFVTALNSGKLGKLKYKDLSAILDRKFGKQQKAVKSPGLSEDNPYQLPELTVQPELQSESEQPIVNTPLLPRQKKYVFDPQKWFYEGLENIKSNPTDAALEAASWIPGLDVGVDIYDLAKAIDAEDYIGAGIGVTSLFLPEALEKGLKGTRRLVGDIVDRYRIANTYIDTNPFDTRVLKKHGFVKDKRRNVHNNTDDLFLNQAVKVKKLGEEDFPNLIRDPYDYPLAKVNGQIVVKPKKSRFGTNEIHFNPNTVYKYDPISGIIFDDVIASSNVPGQNRQFLSLLQDLPKGTVLSSEAEALSVPQVIQNQNYINRLRYYMSGKLPENLSQEIVPGYSTDIMEQLATINKHKRLQTLPSATTKINGTNVFGKNFDSKYKKYFGEPNEDGVVSFLDMTPEQVDMWNNEVAEKLGVYIDPVSRTANQNVVIVK